MIHFEDMIAGQSMTNPAVVVDRDEMTTSPSGGIHFRSTSIATFAASHGGLTASGLFILAVKQRLSFTNLPNTH